MADVYINATDIVVSLNISGTWKVVACGTTNDLDSSLTAIDYSSKCGSKYGPGSKYDQTIKFEGKAVDQTGGASKESYKEIYDLFDSGTQVAARFGKANPGSTDYYFYGDVFVQNFGVQAPYDDSLKFTADFKVVTPPLALYSGY